MELLTRRQLAGKMARMMSPRRRRRQKMSLFWEIHRPNVSWKATLRRSLTSKRALLASDRQTSHAGCRSTTADRSWPGGHVPQVRRRCGHGRIYVLQAVRQRASRL